MLLATGQSIEVPFTATITVGGISQTWFASPILGPDESLVPGGTLVAVVDH